MSKSQGFILTHRKILESRVFQNEGLFKLWMWCLLKAGFKERWLSVQTGRGETEVLLKEGQFLYGRKTAAAELNMSASTVYDRMKKLEKMKNISIQPGTHYSIITIINWDSYQRPKKWSGTQPGTQLAGMEQPSDTNNNVNNDKNGEGTNTQLGNGLNQIPESIQGEYTKKSPIPSDYTLTDYHRDYALKKGYPLETTQIIFEKFIAYHEAQGTKNISWQAAWRTWILNEDRFHPNQSNLKTHNLTNEELLA